MPTDEGFDVQPLTLEAAAEVFRTLGDRLSHAMGQAQTELASLSGMEGSDEFGALFREYALPMTADLTRVLGWTVTGLRSLGDGLDVQAGNYARADEASEAGLRGLRLGEPPR